MTFRLFSITAILLFSCLAQAKGETRICGVSVPEGNVKWRDAESANQVVEEFKAKNAKVVNCSIGSVHVSVAKFEDGAKAEALMVYASDN